MHSEMSGMANTSNQQQQRYLSNDGLHHIPQDSYNVNASDMGQTESSDTPVKRRPGRPKGSGKKNPQAADSPPVPKRPVGRPRRDGLPAGSVGPSRPRKSAGETNSPETSMSASANQYRPQFNSEHASSSSYIPKSSGKGKAPAYFDSNLDADEWAELARNKPSTFLSALVNALNDTSYSNTSGGLTVEEAFKSHLVSLAPTSSQNQHIPSLYSILKTFWLPCSPSYFALTASTSTARTPCDHRFLYWDPQPLVFNGIACSVCSAPLLNQGRIRSGPIRIHDIERPFFVIGCEYVCKSVHCTSATSAEGRKFASTDPSILRALPAKLRDEFPARLMFSDTDAGSGANVWNWQALGVSKSLWNLVRSCVRAGLRKEGILQLIRDVQKGAPDISEEKKTDDHEGSDVGDRSVAATNGNSSSQQGSAQAGSMSPLMKQKKHEGFTDAYSNAWKANTATARTNGSQSVSQPAEASRANAMASIAALTGHSTQNNTQNTGPATGQHPYGTFTQGPAFQFRFNNSYEFPSASGIQPSSVAGTSAPTNNNSGPSDILNGSTLSASTSATPILTHATPKPTSMLHPSNTLKRPYPFPGPSEEQYQSTAPSSSTVVLGDNNPRKRSPRHCSKCGSVGCRGKGGRAFCTNPCKDCGKLECRGRNSRRPDKPCTEGWG